MQIATIVHLALKDWKLFFNDRQAALLCFAVPILLASTFGAIFYRADSAQGMPCLPIYIVNEDHEPFTQQVIERLCTNQEIDARQTSRQVAFKALDKEETGVVLILPQGFGQWIQNPSTSSEAKVEIYHQPTRAYEGRWAEGVLTEAFLKSAANQWTVSYKGALSNWSRPFEVSHARMPGSLDIAAHAYAHSFCGMTLQYLLFWGMDSGLLLLSERRRGIWHRMRAAPMGFSSMFLSRVLSISVIALLQIATTFSFGALVFDVQIQGSMIGFGLMALSSALLASATGLLVASIGGTEARARSLSIVAILSLSLLGGLWLPSMLMPDWAQRLALALPTTWAARGFAAATWRGQDLTAILPCVGMVTLFSLVFLVFAFWRLRSGEARMLRKGELP